MSPPKFDYRNLGFEICNSYRREICRCLFTVVWVYSGVGLQSFVFVIFIYCWFVAFIIFIVVLMFMIITLVVLTIMIIIFIMIIKSYFFYHC